MDNPITKASIVLSFCFLIEPMLLRFLPSPSSLTSMICPRSSPSLQWSCLHASSFATPISPWLAATHRIRWAASFREPSPTNLPPIAVVPQHRQGAHFPAPSLAQKHPSSCFRPLLLLWLDTNKHRHMGSCEMKKVGSLYRKDPGFWATIRKKVSEWLKIYFGLFVIEVPIICFFF